MKFFLGSDHAAFNEKNEVKKHLIKNGLEVIDCGPESEERCNYPDFAIKVARCVSAGEGRGILLCGSGIGVSMVANRFKRVRGALCRRREDARLSREHNDANVLCLGARISSLENILDIVDAWIETPFAGGRHEERIVIFNELGE